MQSRFQLKHIIYTADKMELATASKSVKTFPKNSMYCPFRCILNALSGENEMFLGRMRT